MRALSPILLALAATTLVAVASLAAGPAAAQQTGTTATSDALKVAVTPSALDITPGGTANITLVVHNPSTHARTVEVGAQAQNATPSVNITFAQKTLTLEPNSTHRILAVVHALPRAQPGEQPFLVGAHEIATTTTGSTTPPPIATARLLVRVVVPAPLPSTSLPSAKAATPAPLLSATPAPTAATPHALPSDAAPTTTSVAAANIGAPLGPGVGQTALVVAGGAAAVGGGASTFAWIRRRGGWLALFAPLYTRLAPSKILDQPTRKGLADLVLSEPGITFGDAQRRLGIGAGALTHHARMLEDAGVLFSSPDGQTRRFFPVGGGYVAPVASLAERALAELRREPASLSTLAARLGVTRQALHYHVKKLISEGKLRAEGDRLTAAV